MDSSSDSPAPECDGASKKKSDNAGKKRNVDVTAPQDSNETKRSRPNDEDNESDKQVEVKSGAVDDKSPPDPGCQNKDANNEDGKKELKEQKDGIAQCGIDALAGTIDLARQQFPERLLSLLEAKTCSEALYWLPEGNKFAVVPDNFAKQVLDPFFQGTKFESFTRKLNRWGYKRVVCNEVAEGTLVYFHPDFRTGNGEKVKNMRSGRRATAGRKLPPNDSQRNYEDRKPTSLAGLGNVPAGLSSSLGVRSGAGGRRPHELELIQNARIRTALLASQQTQPDIVARLQALEQEEALRRLVLERQLQAAQLRMDQLAEERLLMSRLLSLDASNRENRLLGLDSNSRDSRLGFSSRLTGALPSNATSAGLSPVRNASLQDALFLRDQLSQTTSSRLTGRQETSPELLQLILLEERRKLEEQRGRDL